MWVIFLSALPPPQQPASRTVYRDSLHNPGWGQVVPSLKKGVAVVQQGSLQRRSPPIVTSPTSLSLSSAKLLELT